MSKIKQHAEEEFGEAWEQDLLDQINKEAQELEEKDTFYKRLHGVGHQAIVPRSESYEEIRRMQDKVIQDARDYEERMRERYGD